MGRLKGSVSPGEIVLVRDKNEYKFPLVTYVSLPKVEVLHSLHFFSLCFFKEKDGIPFKVSSLSSFHLLLYLTKKGPLVGSTGLRKEMGCGDWL